MDVIDRMNRERVEGAAKKRASALAAPVVTAAPVSPEISLAGGASGESVIDRMNRERVAKNRTKAVTEGGTTSCTYIIAFVILVFIFLYYFATGKEEMSSLLLGDGKKNG